MICFKDKMRIVFSLSLLYLFIMLMNNLKDIKILSATIFLFLLIVEVWLLFELKNKSKKPNEIIGYYDALGYKVVHLCPDSKGIVQDVVVYEAGNSKYDSQRYVSTVDGLNVSTLAEFCERTAKELAEEYKANYIGVFFMGGDNE